MVIKKPCKKASFFVFAFVSAKGCTLIFYPWLDSIIYPVDVICLTKGSKYRFRTLRIWVRYSNKRKQQQQRSNKQYTVKSTINVLTPHTFSVVRYGYCYYMGELPIGWHSMTRDCLKLYFEPYWLNESVFTLGWEVITFYQN